MKKRKQLFSLIFTIIFCVAAFAMMTFFSLSEKPLTVGENASGVAKAGDFSGENILFVFPFDSVFFSFEETETRVYLLGDGENAETLKNFGYEVNKTVTADYSVLGGLIDRLGGIELSENGERLTLAGVQVAEVLSRGADNRKRREITEKVFEKISEGCFGTDELNLLLENTQTNLSFPDGYDILKILPQAAQNLNFINQEEQ